MDSNLIWSGIQAMFVLSTLTSTYFYVNLKVIERNCRI
jgi:hypothetical protein